MVSTYTIHNYEFFFNKMTYQFLVIKINIILYQMFQLLMAYLNIKYKK